jgi:hypothetical protein
MYYLRTRAAADAIKFTVDTSALNNVIYTYVDYQTRDDPSSGMGPSQEKNHHQLEVIKTETSVAWHDIVK